MTIEQFRTLDTPAQIGLLLDCGETLVESRYDDYVVHLYYLAPFFAVVIIDAGSEEVLRIIPLKQRGSGHEPNALIQSCN